MQALKGIPRTALLFYSNLTILFVGMGLFPVLPYYAAQFGAGPSLIGIYYAIINAALAAGSLLAGSLAARFNIKRLFFGSGFLGIPALVFLGQATQLWQVVALTSAVWFFGGLNLALISMLLGLITRKENRGRSFSLLSLSIPLGALFGGGGVGFLLAELGYGWMFFLLGVLWAGLPLVSALLPEEKALQTDKPAPVIASGYKFYRLSEPFAAVLFISLFAAIAISVGRLGAPLAMQNQAFSSTEVAASAMVGGLAAIPVVIIVGSFSDKIRRSRSLIVAYLFAAAGILTLSMATQLWHYWLAASSIMIAFCLNGALASAVATDVLPPQDMKRGLAWLNAALPAASIIAFAGTGYLSEILGFQLFFFLICALPLAASGLMEAALQRCRRALKPKIEPAVVRGHWEENAYIKRCL